MKALYFYLRILLLICFAMPYEGKAQNLSQEEESQNTPQEEQVLNLSIEPLLIPTPVKTTEGRLIVYELQVMNKGENPITIRRLEVYDSSDKTKPLVVYAQEKMRRNTEVYSREFKPLRDKQEIEPGGGGIIDIFITLKEGQEVPQNLQNDIWVSSLSSNNKYIIVKKIEHEVAINTTPPLVIDAPLKGKNWVAAGGIDPSSYHRRAALGLDEKIYLSQRFAIDWMKVNEEGIGVLDDVSKPENWLSYDHKVLAVADGVISKIGEGFKNQTPPFLPENMARNEITGNYILLEIEQNGQKYYAFYAHLKPDSILVKQGDRVTTGQVLARTGNTGHSSGPHLHFHICNANDALKAEGLPFVFKKSKIQGRAENISEDMGRWKWNKKLEDSYTIYENIMPIDNQVFDFNP